MALEYCKNLALEFIVLFHSIVAYILLFLARWHQIDTWNLTFFQRCKGTGVRTETTVSRTAWYCSVYVWWDLAGCIYIYHGLALDWAVFIYLWIFIGISIWYIGWYDWYNWCRDAELSKTGRVIFKWQLNPTRVHIIAVPGTDVSTIIRINDCCNNNSRYYVQIFHSSNPPKMACSVSMCHRARLRWQRNRDWCLYIILEKKIHV